MDYAPSSVEQAKYSAQSTIAKQHSRNPYQSRETHTQPHDATHPRETCSASRATRRPPRASRPTAGTATRRTRRRRSRTQTRRRRLRIHAPPPQQPHAAAKRRATNSLASNMNSSTSLFAIFCSYLRRKRATERQSDRARKQERDER